MKSSTLPRDHRYGWSESTASGDPYRLPDTAPHTPGHDQSDAVTSFRNNQSDAMTSLGHNQQGDAVTASVWSPNGHIRQKAYQPVHFDATKTFLIGATPNLSTSNEEHRMRTDPNLSTSNERHRMANDGFEQSQEQFQHRPSTGAVSSNSLPQFRSQIYRKGSDPGHQQNDSYFQPHPHSSYMPPSELLTHTKRPPRTRSTSNKMLYEDQDEPAQSLNHASEEPPREPPPVFRNFAAFEKHYGASCPSGSSSTLPASSFRKRYIHRQSFPFVTRPNTPKQDFTRPVSVHEAHGVRFDEAIKCSNEDFIKLDECEKEDKVLEPCLNGDRIIHPRINYDAVLNPRLNGNGLLDSQCGRPMQLSLPVDRVKAAAVVINEVPMTEHDVVKSATIIQLSDSGINGSIPSIHKSQRPVRSIAVLSVGRPKSADMTPKERIVQPETEELKLNQETKMSTSRRDAKELTEQNNGVIGEWPLAVVIDEEQRAVVNDEDSSRSHTLPNNHQKEQEFISALQDGPPLSSHSGNTSCSRAMDNQTGSVIGGSPNMRQADKKTVSNSKPVTELTDTDWYRKVFRVVHKLEEDGDSAYQSYVGDDSDYGVIPPRPTNTKKLNTENNLQAQSSKCSTSNGISTIQYSSRGGKRLSERSQSTAKSSGVVQCSVDSETCGSDSTTSPNSTQRCSTRHVQSEIVQNGKKLVKPAVNKKSRNSGMLPKQHFRSEEDYEICDDAYWLKLGGLENKEPKTSTMIVHSNDYNSDWESTSDHHARKHEDIREKPKKISCVEPLGTARALFDFASSNKSELSFQENDVINLIKQIDQNWYQGELRGVTGLVPANYLAKNSDSKQIIVNGVHFKIFKDPVPSYPSSSMSTKVKTEDQLQVLSNGFASGLGSPISSSPLSSSIVSNNAGLSSNFETDLDLDQLLYDTLLTTREDSSFSNKKHTVSGIRNGCKNSREMEKNGDSHATLGRGKYLDELLSGVNVDTSQFDSLLNDMTKKQAANEDYEGASYDVGTRTVAAILTPRSQARNPRPEGHWYPVLYDYRPQRKDELELHEGELVYLTERGDDGWCFGHKMNDKTLGSFPGNYIMGLR